MHNYKTKLPGIDRSSDGNKMGRANSSALQKGTREYTNVGSSPNKFMGMGLMGKAAKAIAPGAVEKMKGTKLGGIVGKFMGM